MRVRRSWPPVFLTWATLSLGCAAEEPPRAPHPPDATPVDAGALDASTPSAALDAAPPPPDAGWLRTAHERWLVLHADRWTAGLRAHLSPAQHPAPGGRLALVSSLDADGLWVEWAGPDSPGEGHLTALLRGSGPPVGVLYDLERRALGRGDLIGTARLDLTHLAATVLNQPRSAGRLLARFDEAQRPAFEAAVERLSTLVPEARWWVEVEVGAPLHALPAAVEALTARATQQRPPPPDWLAQVHAAGLRWVPRAGPPDLGWSTGAPPTPGDLRTSLALARRGADTLVVDGIGAWQTDGQLDPVGGEDTDRPTNVTAGHLFEAYGDARLRALRDTLGPRSGAVPDDLGADPPGGLMLAQGVESFTLRPDGERWLAHLGGPGPLRAEVLLDARLFTVPAGVVLRYARSDARGHLALRDETGALSPPPPPEARELTLTGGAMAGALATELLWVIEGQGELAVSLQIHRAGDHGADPR